MVRDGLWELPLSWRIDALVGLQRSSLFSDLFSSLSHLASSPTVHGRQSYPTQVDLQRIPFSLSRLNLPIDGQRRILVYSPPLTFSIFPFTKGS